MLKRICCGCGCEVPATKRQDAKFCSVACGNRLRNKAYYNRHPQKFAEQRRKEGLNRVKRILTRVKSRAKTKGLPFNLDENDIVVPSVCPVLGIDIVMAQQSRGFKDSSASVDRIEPDLGYVKGNVRIISGRANLLKSNATVEELEAVLADLKGLRHG